MALIKSNREESAMQITPEQMARDTNIPQGKDGIGVPVWMPTLEQLTAYTSRVIELCADKMPEIELTGLETESGKEVIDRHNQLVRIYRQKILALKPTGKEGQ